MMMRHNLRTVITLYIGTTSVKSQPDVLIFIPALENIEHS